MKTRMLSFVSLALILLFLPALTAGQDLAAIARAQKEQKEKEAKEGQKSTKVYTTDDVKGKGGSEQQTGSPAEAEATGNTITAYTKGGSTVRVAPSNDTDLIFMATWCPYSKQFKNMLTDARTKPYIANRKLVFLFSNDEWQRVKSNLEKSAKSENASQEDVENELAQLKQKAGSPYVTDPTFLDGLPGETYFCPIPAQVSAFPRILSTNGYSNRNTWLANERNMPVEMVNKVSDDYDPDKK